MSSNWIHCAKCAYLKDRKNWKYYKNWKYCKNWKNRKNWKYWKNCKNWRNRKNWKYRNNWRNRKNWKYCKNRKNWKYWKLHKHWKYRKKWRNRETWKYCKNWNLSNNIENIENILFVGYNCLDYRLGSIQYFVWISQTKFELILTHPILNMNIHYKCVSPSWVPLHFDPTTYPKRTLFELWKKKWKIKIADIRYT